MEQYKYSKETLQREKEVLWAYHEYLNEHIVNMQKEKKVISERVKNIEQEQKERGHLTIK